MSTLLYAVFCFNFACLVLGFGLDEITDVVNVESGPLVGKEVLYDGQAVKQYLGIPFAEPPVGKLRFKKPISIKPWVSTYQALNYRESCMQYLYDNDKWLIPNLDISEDCLHLNVFVPNGTNETGELKAVMVWIHGGGFTNGQGSMYDGSYLALKGDVIVVTINYRLGLLGFLSTEDYSARGNYGLWDQVLAFKWVHDNIEQFGGDKDKVTIFGESAGGFSASLQTILPINKGHFIRSIAESGTACSPSAIAVDTLQVAKNAAEKLNCPTGNGTDALVDCLRTVPAANLLAIQSDAINGFDNEAPNFHNRLGVVVDGELLTDEPTKLLSNKQSEAFQFFDSLDILAGTNTAEALLYWRMLAYQDKYNFSITDGIPDEVLCSEVAPMVSRTFYNSSGDVEEAICEHYSRPEGSLADSGRSLMDMYSDMEFFIPTIRILDFHASSQSSGRTFQYLFDHEPAYPWIQDRPVWLEGANHVDEEPFVFGLDAMYPKDHIKPAEERELSAQVMEYWTNFAKTGDPNPVIDDLPIWPEYDIDRRPCMNLTIGPQATEHMYADRVTLWTKTIPELVGVFRGFGVSIIGR